MTKAKNKAVRVTPKSQTKNLSAAQKKFNTLGRQIEKQKKLLLEWKDNITTYNNILYAEYEPLIEPLSQLQLQWIQLLDTYYPQPLFKKTDKAKIKHIILDICDDLLVDMQTEEVKAIFNKYGEADFDTLKQEENAAIAAMMKGLASDMFEIDIDEDIDVNSPEQFQAYIAEKLEEKNSAFAEQEPAKKTKKQLANEARQQEEEALASKSVQEIYRKLVAVLHPDREPDAAERERKTELMQRVNIAYGKKDLLQLLSLQLEIEQIDLAHINTIADSRLKHFNKILGEQLIELQQETYQIEHAFKMQLQMPFFASLSPKDVLSELAGDIQDVQGQTKYLQTILTQLDNPTAFKAWIKNYKIPKANFDDDWGVGYGPY